VHSPETNGFAERFYLTVQKESSGIAFRRTFYDSVDQLQIDLEEFLGQGKHADRFD